MSKNGNLRGGAGLIDVHTHLLPSWYTSRLGEQGMVTIGGRSLQEPDLQWTPERALDYKDRCGIETSILSFTDPGASIGPKDFSIALARECNEYLARLKQDHPTRFGAFAVLPLPHVDEALAELEYALDTLKLDGLVLLSNYQGIYPGDERFEPLFAELSRRKLPVFIHPGLPQYDLPLPYYPWIMEFVFDTTRAAANMVLSGTLDRHPGIPIILSHGGGTLPYLSFRLKSADMIHGFDLERDVLEYLKDYYYDTTFSAAAFPIATMLELVETDHILFGSDYPFGPGWLTEHSVKDLAENSRLSDADRALIHRGSAEKLFPQFGR
ncbi:amidohydrolase family protein [Leisingera sp. ANG-Vp]|uniref:amidohydrolase family protein n=1 Tax=Leisingera sp. ANG-Vp TaxID=1577896 RepID=UPI000AEE0679|nr:amidohydrolase family protein [Leisingera sp. ANG-Vp]